MKRFWTEVAVEPVEGAYRVTLDGRPIRTQGGRPQTVGSRPLAEALAGEWRAQGEEVDPHGFPLRDLADYALDHVAGDREAAIEALLRYAETDTLCYRADPDEPLFRRQQALWEPLVAAVFGALAILPLTALPLVTLTTAMVFGIGAGLGTARGARLVRRADVKLRRLVP